MLYEHRSRVNKNKWQVQTKCIPAYSDCSKHSINNNVFKKESGITIIIIIIKRETLHISKWFIR